MTEPVVRLRGLAKRFGRRMALFGIDLVIESGQILGVLGADGAGKTSLIRALGGLLEIEAEEATVLGFDLRSDVTELKRLVGYVSQSFGLHRDLSVIENLRFTARLHRIPAEAFADRSRELLERTGLAPFADRRSGALSGGMKQKLAVANALLARPPLLLLDEPTAGVDVSARAEILELLRRERERSLVVMSTSYLDEANLCDRLLVLDRGRIVADGTPEELRSGSGLEVYRAWGGEPRTIAREARRLPYVRGARAAGRFARVEVEAERSPGTRAVLDDLARLDGVVWLAEHAANDLESALFRYSAVKDAR